MLNKINASPAASPAFTSNVRVVYTKNFGLSPFYSSNEMKNQLDFLKENGKEEDTVTLLPVKGFYAQAPCMQVQVMRPDEVGNMRYTTTIAKEPNEILTAYKEADKALDNLENTKLMRDDVAVIDYIA